MNPSSARETPAETRIHALIIGHGSRSIELAAALGEEDIEASVCPDLRSLERSMDTLIGELVIVGGHPDLDSAWEILAFLAEREEPALFLSPTRTESCLRRALAAGATDVLPPPHSHDAIAFRARVVARRDVPVGLRSGGRNEIRAGSLSLDLKTGLAHHEGEIIELSRREFDLLSSLVNAGGGVVSRRMLIQGIWGTETEEGAAVLDTTVHRLRRKLRRSSETVPNIRTIRGIGYLLDVEAS